MSADYWVAMSYESNISVRQQRIISWYLSHHLVHHACAPQHEIAKVGALHVDFQQEAISVDSSKYGVKKVHCFGVTYRELSKYIQGKYFKM